jgi:hypothetical protein
MKRVIMALMVILVITSGAIAQETLEEEKKIGVTLDFTYLSRWLSKGFPVYGDQGALFQTLDLDFYGSGFGLITVHRSSTSNYDDRERFDFRPYFKNTVYKDTPYEMNYPGSGFSLLTGQTSCLKTSRPRTLVTMNISPIPAAGVSIIEVTHPVGFIVSCFSMTFTSKNCPSL